MKKMTTGVSTKRLYLLTVTDGASELKAMEYQKIDSLDCNIEPGMKVNNTYLK